MPTPTPEADVAKIKRVDLVQELEAKAWQSTRYGRPGIKQREAWARATWITGLKECGNTGNKAVALNAAMDRAREELA
jgi:hypothetical protein